MASTLTQDASKVDMAISAAESFTKLYYEYVDKMRHKLNKLYHQEGILVWNGNQVAGAEKIQKFFEELPSSIHSIISLDSQPLASNVVNEQTTILITTSGFVTYNANKQPFQQTFLITAVDENWKVVSDCLRFQK